MQGYDRYAYVNNDPVRYTDPTGRMAWNGEGGNYDDEHRAHDAYVQQRDESLKCAAGRKTYCSFAENHPVQTGAFIAGGLVLEGVVAAAVGVTTVTAETITITTTTAEGANIACGNDMCASEAEQIVTVIGRFDANKKLAESIGANWLNVQDDLWNTMSMAERWARNKQWLQEAVIRGDIFHLASPISKASPDSMYAMELDYLFRLGYTVTANQQYLIPPRFLP